MILNVCFLEVCFAICYLQLSYVLDHNRPGAEVIVKEGDVCLTREDFWSLGLPQCMESNEGILELS